MAGKSRFDTRDPRSPAPELRSSFLTYDGLFTLCAERPEIPLESWGIAFAVLLNTGNE